MIRRCRRLQVESFRIGCETRRRSRRGDTEDGPVFSSAYMLRHPSGGGTWDIMSAHFNRICVYIYRTILLFLQAMGKSTEGFQTSLEYSQNSGSSDINTNHQIRKVCALCMVNTYLLDNDVARYIFRRFRIFSLIGLDCCYVRI